MLSARVPKCQKLNPSQPYHLYTSLHNNANHVVGEKLVARTESTLITQITEWFCFLSLQRVNEFVSLRFVHLMFHELRQMSQPNICYLQPRHTDTTTSR